MVVLGHSTAASIRGASESNFSHSAPKGGIFRSTLAIGAGAAMSVALCWLVRWVLDGILQSQLPFGIFLIGVLISAWRGGPRQAMVATVLGLLCGFWFFLGLRHSDGASGAAGWISAAGYLATGLLLSAYAQTAQRARARLDSEARSCRAQQEQLSSDLNLMVKTCDRLKTDRRELEELLRLRSAELDRLKTRLQGEDYYLQDTVRLVPRGDRLVGRTAAIERVLAQAEQVAPTDSTVLLLGETGTGKGLLAATIHELSARRAGTLVSVNCAAMPAALVESELFGREKGAFTGSLSRQIGRFELADRSTIFLDEIGELSPEVQSKLLRVLETRQVERLGNPKPVTVDVRVLAATNRDIELAVREGKFRQDLYYRLNVFPIVVPPLRERREDIPLLVWAFVDEFSKLFNKNIQAVEKASLDALQRYAWPGNVRELRNLIERAMIVASGPRLRIELPPAPVPAPPTSRKLEEVEHQYIIGVLEKCGWRIRGEGGAADQLGLKPTTLEAKMAKLGIRRPTFGVEP